MINLIARLIPVRGQGIRPCKAREPRARRVKICGLCALKKSFGKQGIKSDKHTDKQTDHIQTDQPTIKVWYNMW